ncbi:MAG: signal peptidase I [Acidobacteria bacterium]|nr:signal peptidase I [Acidobacteriota bacterium]
MYSTRAKLLIGFAVALVFLCGAGVITFLLIVQPVRVEGKSMEPTLHDGDGVFFCRAIGEIERGDIVLFRYPGDETKSYYKRIIALPGETVELREGRMFINGTELSEPYVNSQFNQSRISHPPVRLNPGEYFVAGDNRDQSYDSRAWGALPRGLIYGEFVGRYRAAGK